LALASGGVIFAGTTTSLDLSVTAAAWQPEISGRFDAFVAKISPASGEILFATYLGGSDEDDANALGVGPDGMIYVAGGTWSPDFPPSRRSSPAQALLSVDKDVFVAALSATGDSLGFTARFGGSGNEDARALKLDTLGNLYLAGVTTSLDFPFANPLQAVNAGGLCTYAGLGPFSPCVDGFVTRLRMDKPQLAFSTYLGGSGHDAVNAIDVTPQGEIVLGGLASEDFPATSGPRDPLASIYVAKINESSGKATPLIIGVANAGSFEQGVAPGGLISLFGVDLVAREGIQRAPSLPVPRTLDGISVEINGRGAPVLAVARANGLDQINLQAPYDIAAERVAEITVNNNGRFSRPARVMISYAQAGIFLVAQGTAAIQHASDYSLVTARAPATPGQVIIIYATGLGLVTPPVPDGTSAPAAPLARALDPLAVFIGGRPAEILYGGLAPGFAGLYQINARVPREFGGGRPRRSVCGNFEPSQQPGRIAGRDRT
jgi:uncharacterized protein (TIGR03437 family)